MQTYRDGVGLERCTACGTALRSKDGILLAPMRVNEVEEITTALADIAIILSRVTLTLERAAGRNAEQIRRAEIESRSGRRSRELEPPLPLDAVGEENTGG